MAAVQLMTAERDGLATKLQAANFFRTATDDYLHDLLRKSENRALEAEGQTWHNSQRVRTLEQQKFQDKQSEGGLAQKNDSLAALLRRTRQEKRQVEDRLHGAFIHVSSLEAKAARAKQLHAAELSDVISNLELSKQVRLPYHLRRSSEQRLEGVTAQRDRLADQVDSLRNGNYAQDREAGSDSLSAQLVDALTSGSAAQKQLHQLQTSNTTLSEELATTTQKLQQQKADSTSRSLVAKERLQARLTAKSKQNQQLAEKVAKLEADVSRLKGQSLQELAGLQSCLDSSLEHLRLSRAELEAMSAQTQARLEQRSLTSTTSDFPSHGALDSTVLPGTQESTPPGGATEATATLSTPEFTDTVDQSEEALLPA
ncbi:hypothetical protein WJX77_009536 [Trebouxia sp. C0004]